MTNKKFIVGSSAVIIVVVVAILAIFFTKTINPQDETLFIKIKGGIGLLSESSEDVNTSISNNFGTIKKIYLEGDQGNNVLIWPK